MSRDGQLNAGMALGLLALLGVAGAAGCAAPKRTYHPAQDHNTLSEIEFVHYLSALPTVSMDEAYHAMLVLADGQDGRAGFEEREAELVGRGVVRKSWGLVADDALDKGTLAFMLVKVCRLPGGLNDALFGSWGPGDRRYALRAAVWHDMLPAGPPYLTVTGGELLTAISQAAEYMENAETPKSRKVETPVGGTVQRSRLLPAGRRRQSWAVGQKEAEHGPGTILVDVR